MSLLYLQKKFYPSHFIQVPYSLLLHLVLVHALFLTTAFVWVCSISLQFSTSCNHYLSVYSANNKTGHGNPFMSYIRLSLNALLLILLTSDMRMFLFLYLNAENQAERDEIHPNPSTVLIGSFGNVNI